MWELTLVQPNLPALRLDSLAAADVDADGKLELVTGGQRLHRYGDYLVALEAQGEDPANYEGYLQAFKFGMPPHGGFALGRLSGEIGWYGVNRRTIDNRRPFAFSQGGSLRRE